jgi:hypothetical protein
MKNRIFANSLIRNSENQLHVLMLNAVFEIHFGNRNEAERTVKFIEVKLCSNFY